MSLDLLLGLQWGDEGKGKIVDAITSDYDIIARFQGGPNAGHTIEFNGNKHVLHTIPSGIFNEKSINIIGNGVVIDPGIFLKEIEGLDKYKIDLRKKLYISKRAHIILPTHKLIDATSEASKGKKKIGSTLKGIGPTYMDKTGRNGIRVGDIVAIPDKGDSEGIVAKIVKVNVRTTQIETRDGNVLIISNSKLTQDTVENWSHGSELTRFTISLSVAYGTDTNLVQELMIKAAKDHHKVKNKDRVFVRLANFGDNGLEMELIFWADQSWYINNYKSEIRLEIDRLFRENNITIPFPQITLHYPQGKKEN